MHDGGLEQSFGLRSLKPHPQPRPALGLRKLGVGRTAAALERLQAPLAEEQGSLVEVARIVGQRDALDNPGAEERRLGHWLARADIRTHRGRARLVNLTGGVLAD